MGATANPPKRDEKNGQEMFTDQRFIQKRNTTHKIHTLEQFVRTERLVKNFETDYFFKLQSKKLYNLQHQNYRIIVIIDFSPDIFDNNVLS